MTLSPVGGHAANGGFTRPRSVMYPVTYRAGVTSNAGFSAAAAHRP